MNYIILVILINIYKIEDGAVAKIKNNFLAKFSKDHYQLKTR